MKKRLVNLLMLLVISTAIYAQAPNSFKYQAAVRDASNNILANQNVSFKLSIYKTSATGVVVYSETHNVTTNNYGLANMDMGTGTVVTGNFSTIDWGIDSYFIKTELDAAGGSTFSDMGISQLQSVPYALNAKSVSGMTMSDLTDVNTAGATTNQILSWNGTNWVPTTSSGGTVYSAGTGILLSGTTFSNTAPDQTVTLSGSGSSSVSGTYPNFTISSTDNNTTYSAGTGMSLSGTTFSAQTTTALWNANQLQGRTVATTAPATNQVLGWSGTQWTPQTVSGGSSPWAISGANINRISGNIGVGSVSTTFSKFTARSLTADPDKAIYGSSQGVHAYNEGVRGRGINGTSNNTGVVGIADGDNVTNYGMWAQASSATGTNNNYGVYGYALGNAGSTNYGVYGEVFAGGGTNYAGYFNGNVNYTGTLTNVSDKRLKTNITPFSGALSKLKDLNIYTYNYKATGAYSNMNLAKEKQYGFLAQDLEKIFPDLVHNNKVPNKKTLKDDGTFEIEKGGAEYKSVNHIGMIPILTKAIQEQQDLIENQQKLIENQKQLFYEQQKLIETLEKRISKVEK